MGGLKRSISHRSGGFSYFCHMETQRQQKISGLLYRELSQIIQSDLKALSIGTMVTVTKVNVSPDLSIAKVYLSIFSATKKKGIIERFRERSGEVRGILGNRVRHQLRIIPQLQFFVDDSLDYIEKIDELLKGE